VRHKVPKWYADASQLINDPEVNAIYIATPPSSHAPYTLMAAQAGKPVYVEKPMAIDYRQCQQMVDACKQAGVPLFVAYYRRCLPNFLKIKDLLQAGAIGEVRFVTIHLYHPAAIKSGELPWRVDPAIAGGGLFYDLGSHQLDILDFFFGPIKKAIGMAANQAGLYPAEDIVCANFAFTSGVMGSGVWCFTTAEKTDRTEIVGSKGKIIYSTFVNEEPVVLQTTTGTQELTFQMPPHIQQPLIQTIVEELQGKGKCPSTGITAARTGWVMDEIMREWKA
jgi:predicted dehydrogenase